MSFHELQQEGLGDYIELCKKTREREREREDHSVSQQALIMKVPEEVIS